MPKGRPRKYAKQSAEGPGKRLSVPDVDWGGRFGDVEVGESGVGTNRQVEDVKMIAAPPTIKAKVVVKIESVSEVQERVRRLIEENPKYPAWERGYN